MYLFETWDQNEGNIYYRTCLRTHTTRSLPTDQRGMQSRVWRHQMSATGGLFGRNYQGKSFHLDTFRRIDRNEITLAQLFEYKDRCDCCSICGQREGERCFNESVARFLSRTYGSYPDCGENLICRLRTDMEANDPPEAVCYCVKDEPICGSDGVSYENECQLTEERYRRRDGLIAASRGPCKTGMA